jgi:PhnB protein
MTRINLYLTFSGNCREAMLFYQQCLGGELTLQTVGDSPLAADLPPDMKRRILHSTLTNGSTVLMGSDMVGEQGVVRGNAIAMMLHFSNEAAARITYEALAAGGVATYPLADTSWGALFGGLIDRFGNHWLLNCTENGDG